MSEHVVSGLIRKRAELAGQIEHLQTEVKRAVIALDNVEATLRLFDPEIDFDAITPRKVPTAHHAFRGEISRVVLTALRESRRPLSTTALSERVMKERGLDAGNGQLRRVMARRVGACLRNHRKRGVVRSITEPGAFNLWELAR